MTVFSTTKTAENGGSDSELVQGAGVFWANPPVQPAHVARSTLSPSVSRYVYPRPSQSTAGPMHAG